MNGACWVCFLLPAFTHQGHECSDLLSPCGGMHVCTDKTLVYALIQKNFQGMEWEPMLTPREKSSLLEAQRTIKPTMLHHVGQRAQHTTSSAILASYISPNHSHTYCHMTHFLLPHSLIIHLTSFTSKLSISLYLWCISFQQSLWENDTLLTINCSLKQMIHNCYKL